MKNKKEKRSNLIISEEKVKRINSKSFEKFIEFL